MNRFKKTATRVAFLIVGIATLVAVIYIMSHQIGLNPDLDFGAGAYYYADIPEDAPIPDYMSAYQAKLPYWVYVVLFLLWGALMYALWKWVDGRKK